MNESIQILEAMDNISEGWTERRAAALIALARQSRYRREIFEDAADFVADGFARDVALMKAFCYWGSR